MRLLGFSNVVGMMKGNSSRDKCRCGQKAEEDCHAKLSYVNHDELIYIDIINNNLYFIGMVMNLKLFARKEHYSYMYYYSMNIANTGVVGCNRRHKRVTQLPFTFATFVP